MPLSFVEVEQSAIYCKSEVLDLKLRSIDVCTALDSPPLSRVRFGCGSEVGHHFQLLVPAPSQTRLREESHRVHVHVHVHVEGTCTCTYTCIY